MNLLPPRWAHLEDWIGAALFLLWVGSSIAFIAWTVRLVAHHGPILTITALPAEAAPR